MSVISDNENMTNDSSEKQAEMDKMREIITSIANEMQRLHDSTIESESEMGIPGFREKQNVFGELVKCKSKIKSKRVRIQKLKQNLETACSVARIVTSAHEKESAQSLGYSRSEYEELLEKNRNNNIIINDLTKENAKLQNKLESVSNFIRLGYEELQKISQEPAEETSVLEQLRKLIICCGQYFADYCNEHDECIQLRQKNNFLTNKSQVLGNNIDALSEQLKTLQYRNFKLQKENDHLKDKSNKPIHNDVEVTVSGVTIKSNSINTCNNEEDEEFTESLHQLDHEHGFDLSPHLTMVKKLLRCQDALLKDLKSLSDEFVNNN